MASFFPPLLLTSLSRRIILFNSGLIVNRGRRGTVQTHNGLIHTTQSFIVKCYSFKTSLSYIFETMSKFVEEIIYFFDKLYSKSILLSSFC